MPVPNFSLQSEVIIIDDTIYDYAPASIKYAYSEGYGVVGDTVLTADLTRVTQVQSGDSSGGWYVNGTNEFVENSISNKMLWQMEWTETSWMNVCMRDHLIGLYTSQRPFWIQFDEEMSREGFLLEAIDDSNKTFQLPTFPLAYYTTATSTASTSYVVNPYIKIFTSANPAIQETTLFRVNLDSGLIKFDTAIASGKIVVKYLWRAYVKIKAIDLQPIQWSQDIYAGTIAFEQTDPGIVVERFDNKYVTYDCIKFDEQIGTVDDSTIQPTNCPCYTTNVEGISRATRTFTCQQTDETYNTGSITIPNTDYVTGIELIDFSGGRLTHCNTPLNETVAKSRLKFNLTGSTYSSFYEKQAQTDALQNHALINNMTVPFVSGDITYGGIFDLFGKPVGVYRGSDLLSGITFNNVVTVPTTSNCGAYTGTLTVTPTNNLTSYSKQNGSVSTPSASSGYSVAGSVITLPMIEETPAPAYISGNNNVEAYVDGNITLAITGPSTAKFTTVRLQLALTLESYGISANQRSYAVNTIFGNQIISNDAVTKVINFDKTFIVPLTAGAGTLVVPLYYYAKTIFDPANPSPFSNKAKVSGTLTYTAGYGCASSPEISSFGIKVYHSPSCPTIIKYHTTASGSGSSSTSTPFLGTNGGILRTSDGTTSGAGTIYCRNFGFPTFQTTALFVGNIVRFKARRVGAAPTATNLVVNPDFNAGNTGFTSEYGYNTLDGFGNLDEFAYSIVTNPNQVNSTWNSFNDHTADTTRNMMVVNGIEGTPTVPADWSFTVAPSSQNTSGTSPQSLNTTHTITATYIGSSPTLPTEVKISIPHTMSSIFTNPIPLNPTDTATITMASSLGINTTYNCMPCGPLYIENLTVERTIPLVAGVGTLIVTMDTSASWTAPATPTITHSFGTISLVESIIIPKKFFWKEVLTLTPTTTYTIEYYLRKIGSSVSPNNNPIVTMEINGTQVRSTTVTDTSAWTKVSFTYTTGAGTSYDIRMYAPLGKKDGNDFAIDDISLTPPTGLGVIRLHVNSESGSNPSKSFTLPTGNTWVEYTLGAADDFWNYGTNFVELSRLQPTSTGTNLNTNFSISVETTNNVGGYWEFSEITSQIYVLNKCGSGIILE